jgi:hypothetical protein
MTYSQLPFNGQTKIINGVSYVYTAANNSWTLGTGIPSSTEIVYADVVYITSTNGINFSDGTRQTTAVALDSWVRGHANAAYNTANASFTKANTGVTLAQAAYDFANNLSGGTAQDGFARNVANTASSNTVILQGVDLTQNTNISNLTSWLSSNISLIDGINATQNNDINTATNLAQSAFNVGTAANTLAQSAFNVGTAANTTASAAASTGKAIALSIIFGG